MAIAIICVAVIAMVIATAAQKQSNQAEEAIIPDVVFCGEYRIDGGDWKPISDAVHISSTKGIVELKGVFKLFYAPTGEELGAVDKGTVITLFLDHIKATIKDQKGNIWESDNENALMGKGLCAETRTPYMFEGEVGEEVTITIYNPHFFGNERAIDSFLNGMAIYDGGHGGVFSYLEPVTFTIGILLALFLIILLGAAIFASLLHPKNGHELWLLWLMVFLGGIYFIFSRDEISVWNPAFAANTMILGSSMMLYMLTAFAIIAGFLEGATKKIAIIVTALLGVVTLGAMLASLIPSVKFYNTYPYWIAVAMCVAAVLGVCIVISLIRRENNVQARKKKFVYIPTGLVLLAFFVDIAATALGVWQGGVLSVIVLFSIVVTASVTIGRVVPKSIKAVLAAKSIEAEKREMEMKLQESHISVMLSQIQPHFLYNTLNSIYYLCETNPMRARSMVNSFSEYLRNNLSSLEETKLISFETELSHIKTYLDIEKIRFEDTLEIEYDIKCVDFSLPVLTVQPIVENAVKHGTSKKRGGGRVIISAFEDKENYIIKVSDTGCGFDPAKPKDDGKRHVGIENVRQRLSNMCGGSLAIESEVGVGTVATITIPKGG